MNIFPCVVGFILLFAGCTPPPSKQIVIAFGGDTMLGRLVNEIINKKGYRYPWGNTLPIFKQADFRIVNLETTLTTSNQPVPKVFNYKANPQNVQALREAQINVVNLANNHAKDFGNEGLLDTIQALNTAQISYVGAGKNIEAARKPVIMKKGAITIGIIGATDNEPTWLATHTNPGTNYFEINNLTPLLQQIAELKKQVDVAIISLHWGPNMRQKPTQDYIDAAHQMIEAGADIIHGHSSHIFQGIELYRHKLIMYDTGDLVDDYQIDPLLRNDQAILFEITIDKDGPQKLHLIPLLISNMQVNLASGAEKSAILTKMRSLSAEFGTEISSDTVVYIK